MKKLLVVLLVVASVQADGKETGKNFFETTMAYVSAQAAAAKDAIVGSTAAKFVVESYKANVVPYVTSVFTAVKDSPIKQAALVTTSAAATLGAVYLLSKKIKNNTYKYAFGGIASALVLAGASYLGYNIYSALPAAK